MAQPAAEGGPLVEASRSGDIAAVESKLALGGVLRGTATEAFLVACEAGQLEIARRLWALGVVPAHATTRYSQTALHLACTCPQPNIALLEFLVRQVGVAVDAKDCRHQTALLVACACRDEEAGCRAVRVLVASGARVDEPNIDGATALALACVNGAERVGDALASAGADVNLALGRRGSHTPLSLACANGHLGVVRMLHRRGARLQDRVPESGCTPFHVACLCGQLDVVRFLADAGVDPHTEDAHGVSTLHTACSTGFGEVARFLVARGADVNQRARGTGDTPLLVAVRARAIATVRVLLELGADVSVADHAQRSPLLVGCQQGDHDVVRLLLEHGADPRHCDRDGLTALHAASLGGNVTTIALMARLSGAHIDQLTNNGDPPLLLAAQEGHLAAVRSLLAQGADVDAADADGGFCALTAACREGHTDVVRLLVGHGADVAGTVEGDVTPLIVAAEAGQLEVVRFLLTQPDVDIEHATDTLQTAFLRACSEGHLDVARLLDAHGAQIDRPDDQGSRPLIYACTGGYLDVVVYLADRGVDLNARDAANVTAFLAACEHDHLAIAQFLASRGVDREVRAYEDRVLPFSVACEEGNWDIVQWLQGLDEL